MEALRDPQASVRREAAKALGQVKDARAVPQLLAALRDKDANVRLYAAYALGEIKDPKTAKELLNALHDPVWGVRDQAAWALREIRDPSVAQPLVAALREENADVAHILWILRHVDRAASLEPLVRLLQDARVVARCRAVSALAELGIKEAVDPLISALKDKHPDVRLLAVAALVRIRDDRAEEPLRELFSVETNPAVRTAAEQAVKRFSMEEALVAHWSFDDANPKVAKDVTARGSDGEIRGCPVVEGKVGRALAFSTGKFVELGKPVGASMANTPLTIMAWVKSDADKGVIVARGGAFCGFSLYIKDGAAKFGIQRERGGTPAVVTGEEKLVGRWAHVAGVVKSDCLELYVDAKLAATTKTKGYIPGNAGQGMEIGFDTANSPVEITDNFQGIIDEVKVYHAALTAKEIAKQCRPRK